MTRTLNEQTGKFEWDKIVDYRKPSPSVAVNQQQADQLKKYKDLVAQIADLTSAKRIHQLISATDLS